MGPRLVLPLWVWVALRVVAMKEYFIFPKTPGLNPHHQMQFNFISKTFVGGRVLLHCRNAICVANGWGDRDRERAWTSIILRTYSDKIDGLIQLLRPFSIDCCICVSWGRRCISCWGDLFYTNVSNTVSKFRISSEAPDFELWGDYSYSFVAITSRSTLTLNSTIS